MPRSSTLCPRGGSYYLDPTFKPPSGGITQTLSSNRKTRSTKNSKITCNRTSRHPEVRLYDIKPLILDIQKLLKYPHTPNSLDSSKIIPQINPPTDFNSKHLARTLQITYDPEILEELKAAHIRGHVEKLLLQEHTSPRVIFFSQEQLLVAYNTIRLITNKRNDNFSPFLSPEHFFLVHEL